MVLEQARLNVEQKKRSNIFNWRGQFTPQFVEYILERFANEGDWVLDPFVGSGTVLQESIKRKLNSTGFEINPAAYFMANFFKFSNIPNANREFFLSDFKYLLEKRLENFKDLALYIPNKESYRESYINLLKFVEVIKHDIGNEQQKTFLANLLFQSEKDKKLTIGNSLNKSFNYLSSCLISLPENNNHIDVFLKDARETSVFYSNKIDLIFTSPPYINVFNYHQNYRAIIESLNYNILKVAHSEFGSNRKNRGNRFKTVVQYTVDMGYSIFEFWKTLKKDGKIVLVLGRESRVRGVPYFNGNIVMDLLKKSTGFKDVKILERQFVNKFGESITEDIIVGTKSSTNFYKDESRAIAMAHLLDSLIYAKQEVISEIEEAIIEVNNINNSPILNPDKIWATI